MPQVIFEPAGHPRDSTAGLEFGGMPYVRGAEFQEMGGPGSSSSRRGAGRERSAAVVEHRRILGKACREGRLAARPARSGHLALGPVQIHRPASFTLFLHGCCDDRRAMRSSTPLSGSRTCAAISAPARVAPGMLRPCHDAASAPGR
jgi:hypothetical protein